MSHETGLGFLLLGLYHQTGNLTFNVEVQTYLFFKFIPTVSLPREKSIGTVGVSEDHRKMRESWLFTN